MNETDRKSFISELKRIFAEHMDMPTDATRRKVLAGMGAAAVNPSAMLGGADVLAGLPAEVIKAGATGTMPPRALAQYVYGILVRESWHFSSFPEVFERNIGQDIEHFSDELFQSENALRWGHANLSGCDYRRKCLDVSAEQLAGELNTECDRFLSQWPKFKAVLGRMSEEAQTHPESLVRELRKLDTEMLGPLKKLIKDTQVNGKDWWRAIDRERVLEVPEEAKGILSHLTKDKGRKLSFEGQLEELTTPEKVRDYFAAMEEHYQENADAIAEQVYDLTGYRSPFASQDAAKHWLDGPQKKPLLTEENLNRFRTNVRIKEEMDRKMKQQAEDGTTDRMVQQIKALGGGATNAPHPTWRDATILAKHENRDAIEAWKERKAEEHAETVRGVVGQIKEHRPNSVLTTNEARLGRLVEHPSQRWERD